MINLNYTQNDVKKQNNSQSSTPTPQGKSYRKFQFIPAINPLAVEIIPSAPTNYDYEGLPHSRSRLVALDGLTYGLIDDDKLNKIIELIAAYERGKSTSHKYLKKKGIRLSDCKGARICRYNGQDCIFIPMLNYYCHHEIVGFQIIGERDFAHLTNEKGERTNKITQTFSHETGLGFNYVGDLTAGGLMGLAEGVATGVSGYYSEEFGAVVFCFSAMQLKRACEAFSYKQIVILADNDIKQYKNQLLPLVNTGRQIANECYFTYPQVIKVLFCEFQDPSLSDFNDLYVRFGLNRLKSAIHYGLIEPELCRLISYYGGKIDIKIVHERYLSELPKVKQLFVKSGLGTGKTEVLKSLIAQAASVLYATHRELLSQNIANRMGILSFYKDKDIDFNFLCLCLPSFIKESLFTDDSTGKYFDLVVTDEASQALGLLIGGLPFDKMATLQAMKEFYNEAGRNIWLDANLKFENVVSYMDMLPNNEPFTFYLNTYPQYEHRQATIYHSNDRQIRLKTMVDKVTGYLLAGKKVAIPCDSEHQAQEIFEKLQPICPKIKLITGKERDGDFIAQINEAITEYDCFIFNSVIGSGVSIDVSHFDQYVAMFNDFLPPSELWQILARPRAWDNYEIYMSSEAKEDKTLLSIAQIKRGYIDLLLANELLDAKKKGMVITEAEMNRRREFYTAASDEFLTIYARHEFERLLERQHYLESFAALGRSYGATIELIALETKADLIAKQVEVIKADEAKLQELLMEKQGLIEKRVARLLTDDTKRADLGLEPSPEAVRAHVESGVIAEAARTEYNKPFIEAKKVQAEELVERVRGMMADETARAKIAEKLGVTSEQISEADIAAELKDGLSHRLKWLELHFKTPDELTAMNELESGKVATDRHYYNVKQYLLDEALRVTGLLDPDSLELNLGAAWSPEDFDHEAINRLIKDNQISLHLIGLVSRQTVPNPQPSWRQKGAPEKAKSMPDSTRFIHKILRKAGIKIKRVRAKVNGATTAHYEVDNRVFLAKWQEEKRKM